MEWRQVQQVPGDSNWRCHGMNGIWNKQCHLHRFRQPLQLSTEVFCSVHSLQKDRGHFVKLQSLQTYGTFDVKSVNINGHTFLSFACYYSGSSYNTDSFTKFVLFQSIATRGALACHPFEISCHTFLGMANYYDSSQKYNTQSAVYRAAGAKFIEYQEISTHGAHDMTSFEYKGHTYLAVANHYNQKYNINSISYKRM